MRWIHNDGVAIDISNRLEAIIAEFRATRGCTALYLYGSYGTPNQTPLSDVDLAAVFRDGELPAHDAELDLIGRVTRAARCDDVSVAVLNRADPIFRHRVLRTGRLLLCVDAVALADFVERTLDEHADFIVDYEAFLREYDAALVEAYGRE